MKHTFAICAYKDSPYLEACMKSLRSQDVKTDIILCTSTPSDYIDMLADKYEVPVMVHVGAGIGEDWNYAYDAADADLVTIAHQDDMYGSKYLSTVLRAAEKYDDMSMFTCGSVTVKENTPIHGGKIEMVKRLLRSVLMVNDFNHLSAVKKAAIRFGNPIICPSCTYNKKLCGDHIFDETHKFTLDWEMLYKLADKPGRWVYESKPLMMYRVHQGAATAACIRNHVRDDEEREMFLRLWPRPIADMLSELYRSSYDAYKQ